MSKAAKIIAYICTRSWIANVSDKRPDGGGILVTLKDGWYFNGEDQCSIRNFYSSRDAAMGSSKNRVNNPTLVKPQKVKKVKVTKSIPAVMEVPVEMKPTKTLSMSKDAIRKREKRAAAKAAKAAE